MSSGINGKMCGTPEQRREVLTRFKAGESKAEIGKVVGRDKDQVAKMLAQAIRETAAQ